MAFEFTVSGADDIEKTLLKIARVFDGPAAAEIVLTGAEELKAITQDNIIAQGLFDSGALLMAVTAMSISSTMARVEIARPYAAAQEFGLPNQPITARQRRFFWAMWKETEEGMWRALALSATYTIPAKPYFRPAIDQGRRMVIMAMAAEASGLLRGAA